MSPSRFIQTLLPLPLIALTSCGSMIQEAVREELARNERESEPSVIQRLRGEISRLQHELAQIEEHLTYCSYEVKSLLSDVQHECEHKLECSSEAIDVAVLKYDPSQHGRFLSLMQERRHQAFYLPSEPRALLSEEKKLLRDLVEPAWLDDHRHKTRFLVVSHPENASVAAQDRAKRRSQLFVEAIAAIAEEKEQGSAPTVLKDLAYPVAVAAPAATTQPVSAQTGIPGVGSPPSSRAVRLIREGRILHWVFQFETSREYLPVGDRPRAANERLNRSVWVYRVDC